MSNSDWKKYLLNTTSKDKWERIGLKRRAGVSVPLFSVYSKNSLGMGDLGDLKLLVDWCKKTGNSILQLLPMNELGQIFCPYDALSSFALEPAYLSLTTLSSAKKKSIKGKMDSIKKLFPAGKNYADYRIKQEKIKLLSEIYFQEYSCNSEEFKKFRKENAYWIEDFALFKVLKDHQGQKPWYEWEDKFKNRDKLELENFYRQHKKEISFQIWLQFELYKQFKDIKKSAQAKKILLKGDLPLLVSRDSVDVWSHPEFFKLEYAAGAPPDMYTALGQRWGMPTYNWKKIEDDDYRYLKERLRYAQNFYDILRIDHVVGLFRIWSIPYEEPLENQGLNGFFDPQEENQWEEHGKKILSEILNSTKMLICAEDLGIIPSACPKILQELGIPGNDVQRWVKDWKVAHDFLEPKAYRLLSVAMLSTHDTTNWPAWWEFEVGTVDEALFKRKCNQHKIEYNKVKDKLFNPTLSRYGRLRWLDTVSSFSLLADILEKRDDQIPDIIDIYENSFREREKLWRQLRIKGQMQEKSNAHIIKAALRITLESRSIFCINTIIDWLYLTDLFKGDPYQYRINKPATISPKNWSLVLPISLEELLEHKVCEEIKNIVTSSSRI